MRPETLVDFQLRVGDAVCLVSSARLTRVTSDVESDTH